MQLRKLLSCLIIGLVLASIPHATVNGQSTSTISGTVRCGTGCGTFGLSDGSPINVAGKVVAVMTTALDPNTGAPRPDLPDTNAQITFDASANGHYELQGLLPGVFDLYASANGYRLTLVVSGFTVHPGESLHYDAYLTPCPSSGSAVGCPAAVPELTAVPIVAFMVLIMSFSLLNYHKKLRRTKRV